MALLNIFYGWLMGSQTEFLNRFQNNEQQYNQARAYWAQLEDISLEFFVGALALGALLAWVYYFPYNNVPGRHYKPTHWCIFLGITLVLAWTLTAVAVNVWASTPLPNTDGLRSDMVIGNIIYGLAAYFLCSVVICNIPSNTKAYKMFRL